MSVWPNRIEIPNVLEHTVDSLGNSYDFGTTVFEKYSVVDSLYCGLNYFSKLCSKSHHLYEQKTYVSFQCSTSLH